MTTAGSSALDDSSHAHWLFQHNGGVFLPPWGKIEQWLISVQHDEADIDRLVGNFGRLCPRVSPSEPLQPFLAPAVPY